MPGDSRLGVSKKGRHSPGIAGRLGGGAPDLLRAIRIINIHRVGRIAVGLDAEAGGAADDQGGLVADEQEGERDRAHFEGGRRRPLLVGIFVFHVSADPGFSQSGTAAKMERIIGNVADLNV